MTRHGAMVTVAAVVALTAGAATAWPAGAPETPVAAPPALVVDAALGRSGRELVAARLRDSGVTLRLPRTAREARTDVRYLLASGHAVIVVGPRSAAAAPPRVLRAPTVGAALAAVGPVAR